MLGSRLLRAIRPKSEPAWIRRAFLLPTLLYPFWHLAAPASAIDPWLAWWIVAASFPLVGLLSTKVRFVERNLLTFFHLCSWLVTLQLYLLAFANDMSTFYVVGSVMAVLATLLFIRTVPNLLAYTAFLVILGGTLFALKPDALKAALWGGVLPIAAGSYHRLSMQAAAARTAREHQEHLEQRVAERTEELSEVNRRLREEMEQRERLEGELRFSQKLEAVGRLAGGVAHDFNNLLTTIAIYADLLLAALPEESSLRSDVGQIQKAGRQASALTQQLLTFSRRREVETQLLDVKEAVERTLKVLDHLLGEDTELVFRHDGARQTIRANADQLEQLLINLALNARDAMPGGGTVRIDARRLRCDQVPAAERGSDLGADYFVLLAVSDTGVGMDAETRARAFDPFFTRKQVNEGTGLGLSLVYGVVKQAGGRVRLLSEPGRGTRVEIYWPGAVQTAEAPYEERAAAPLRGGSERILLVEDDTDLRFSLERVLRDIGYRVLGTESAEEGLEAALRDDFDLVVSDVVMPRMSGFELIEKLSVLRPDLPVMLVSGQLNHPSLREQSLPAGVTLLSKPFTVTDLASRVREVLDAHAREQSRLGAAGQTA